MKLLLRPPIDGNETDQDDSPSEEEFGNELHDIERVFMLEMDTVVVTTREMTLQETEIIATEDDENSESVTFVDYLCLNNYA